MTAAARRPRAPRLAPTLWLEEPPTERVQPVVAAPPAEPAEPAKPKARNFDVDLERVWLGADTYVEREYRAGYHHYSLWEEGRDGVGYHRESLRHSVRWGRVDTSYPYEAPGVPAELLGKAIDDDLKRLRELEDRIIATCPELEALDLPGPLYRSRGVVRLGGDPRVRFNAAMSRRPPT